MKMILIDNDDKRITLCEVESIDEARDIWCRIASMGGSDLSSFEVISVVYEGNYVTDEC